MSENHQAIMNHNLPLPPEDTQPHSYQDSQDQIISRHVYGEQTKRRIKRLDARQASAYRLGTSTIRLQENDIWEDREVEIRSISGDIMERIAAEYNKVVASFPMKWNEETKSYDQDFYSPAAEGKRGQLIALQNKLAIDKVLYGCLIEIVDKDGEVVWDVGHGITKDKEVAIERLWALGLTYDDIKIVANDIDDLMRRIEREEQEALEKK